MSVSSGYTFDMAANFVFTNTQIESLVGKLAFANNPTQLFTQPFTSDAGFTYTASLAEFVAGLVRQKNQVPNTLIAADYNTDMNLIWRTDTGSLAAVLNGTPTLVSNKLNCTGVNGLSYVHNTSIRESYKFKFTPNYTGLPPANINLISVYNGANNNDRLDITHSPSGGTFRVRLYNSVGTPIIGTIATGLFSPTAGQEYEIEVVMDSVAGDVRIFLDGVLVGTSSVAPWTRLVGVSAIHIGAFAIIYNISDGLYDDLITYDNAQHSASYTPGYSVPISTCLESRVTAPTFVYSDTGSLLSIQSVAATEVGSPQYIINGLYWNGTIWTASDGTYIQSNTLAVVNTNIGSIAINPASVDFSIMFPTGTVVSSVDDFVVNYTGQKHELTGYIDPAQCIEAKTLIGYSHNISEPASTDLGVVIRVDGISMYWDGSAWVNSDDTFAQSNTAAQVNTNIGSLALNGNSTACIRWVFLTSDIHATPTITDALVTYDYGAVLVSTQVCEIYGYIKDISDNPIVGADVSFDMDTLSNSSYQEAASRIMSTDALTVTTDANGYFSISLIRTSEYTEGGSYVVQVTLASGSVIGAGAANTLSFEVPDSVSKDITDLLPAA